MLSIAIDRALRTSKGNVVPEAAHRYLISIEGCLSVVSTPLPFPEKLAV